MLNHNPDFGVRLASGPDDLAAVQRLRYDVFVRELGAQGALVDHAAGFEADRFDLFAKHLLLEDLHPDAPAKLVGVYRLLDQRDADRAGQFYSEAEFDVTAMRGKYERILELGRACLHDQYRGGTALHHIWSGVSRYVRENRYEVLFGVASFQGTNTESLAAPLSYLYHYHAAPVEIAPVARTENARDMNMMPQNHVDRKAALLATPALIKAYLRMGGVVGRGAFVDHAFKTTDVCLLLETSQFGKTEGRFRTMEAGQ